MAGKKIIDVLAESTLMPISFITLIGGVVFWASSIAARTDSNDVRLGKLEAKQQEIVEMEEQLAAVQTKVDMIYDRIRLHEAAGMIVAPRKPLPKN